MFFLYKKTSKAAKINGCARFAKKSDLKIAKIQVLE